MTSSGFMIVCIPQNDAEALSQRRVEYTQATLVSCLTDALKAHFQKKQPMPKGSAKLSEFQETLKRKVQDSGAKNVDADAMAKMMASVQLVDIVPLLPQHKVFGWECVSMYVDDSALTKGVPINRRASELCVACGTPKQIYGDAFVARALDDNEDLFKRKDFTLDDMDSSAQWVRKAQTLQAAIKRTKGGRTTAPLEGPIAPSEDDLKKAAQLKASGNEAFKSSKFKVACEAYLKAIDVLGKPSGKDKLVHESSAEMCRVLWLNVSAANLGLKNWNEAAEAATRSIEFWPKAKAYFRRGVAMKNLGRLTDAARDFQSGLKLKPRDPTLQRHFKETTKELERGRKTRSA